MIKWVQLFHSKDEFMLQKMNQIFLQYKNN
jgi:hypothetical protein